MTDMTTIEQYMMQAAQENDPEYFDDEQDFMDYRSFYEAIMMLFGEEAKQGLTGTTFPGAFREIETHGGEGQGEEWYVIFSYQASPEAAQEFFKLDAHYESWDGVYFDEATVTRVEQQEVVRIEWVEVK